MQHNLKLRRRTLLTAFAAYVTLPGCVRAGDAPSNGDSPVADPPGGQPLPSVEPGASGRVFERAGRPLAQVFVQAIGAGPNDPPVPEMAVFSDDRGFWHWTLRPGRYVLTFSLEGYATQQHEIEVGEGETVTLDVVLE